MSEAILTAAAAAAALKNRIQSRQARVGIVGLGYVGLPLAVEFAKAGFPVTGIDVSEEKTRRVNAGESYVGDISTATLSELVKAGKIAATSDFSVVGELDTINICVPTPLRKTKDPDMSYIVSACQEIAQVLPPGDAGHSGIHHLSRHHRRIGAAHAGQIRSGSRAAISFSASRPSA